MAWPLPGSRLLRARCEMSAREIDLHADQIAPGNHLGDRMLDLDARVHFQEIKLESFGIDDELDGTSAAVVRGTAEIDGGGSHAIANRCGNSGAGHSSITFWKRRCNEQSRSNRCTASPSPNPKTWISTWRAFGM